MRRATRGRFVAVALCLVVLTAVPAGALGNSPDRWKASEADDRGDASEAGDRGNASDDRGRGRDGPTGGENVTVTYEYHLTPADPGAVDVVITVDVPSAVSHLEVTVPRDASVSERAGFEPVNDPETLFAWTDATDESSLRFAIPANVTNQGRDRDLTVGPYFWVDAGSWAVVESPRVTVDWRGAGGSLNVSRRYATAGPGVATRSMAYLGPHATHNRTVAGQTLTLVEPDAASLAEDPGDLLDAMAAASRSFEFGDRDDRVVAVAAPTRSVDWLAGGLTPTVRVGPGNGDYAPGDAFWVRDAARLTEPANVWIHEYVHTRQTFVRSRQTAWILEGSAEYFAALAALDAGRIDFGQFRAALSRGTTPPQSDAVLSRPETWDFYSQYTKGGVVVGELDRRLRLATDGRRSFASVIRRLNARDGLITLDVLRDVATAVGDESFRRAVERYGTTTAAPSLWSADAHAAAFGADVGGLDVSVDAAGATVSGPYRNGSVGEPPFVLTTGESVTLPVAVENLGESPANYSVPLVVDDEVVARRSGQVEPGGRVTVRLNHTFPEADAASMTVFGESVPVDVERPDGLIVSDLSVNRTTASPGDAIALTVTVRNDGAAADRRTIVLSQGFSTVAERTVALGPGERTTVTETATLPGAGEYRYTVGDRGPVTVTVRDPNAAPNADGANDSDDANADGANADGANDPDVANGDGTSSDRSAAWNDPGPIAFLGIVGLVLVVTVLVFRGRLRP